jgi:UDP-N-acetylmuramoyl-L-alanyl-D-glutamate--2,6-diaminopimelate ligase
MKLKKILKDLPITLIRGSKDLEITGICSNSKLVAPGNLFVARKGRAEDGVLYIPEAIAAGAVAIITDIYNPLLDKTITQIIHPNVAFLESLISAHYYQFPSKELFMVGITGTNGKTTTSFLIKHLLENSVGPCGLIGTIEYIIGKHSYQATRTTPDAPSTQKMLREMIVQGCQNAIMEVTSHALDQNRVDHIDFDVAVFTNLTLDHLDYHQTMENYLQAKNRLFRFLDPTNVKKIHPINKTAIVNVDSPWHERILENCQADVVTYGILNHADLMAEKISLSPIGTSLILNFKGNKVPLSWPLVGRFNAYNCLAAVAVGLSRKIPLEHLANLLSSAPFVSGRLEAVPNPLGLKIYVDFAHSDDALSNVLECLNEFKTGRIITVFGCGGNRDITKRPKMAQVCEELSDIVIVTSDNPRNEDPQDIINQIIQGFKDPHRHFIEADRTLAIEKAIDLANPNDIILIAGKGHETHQIFSHKIIDFDDRQVALQLCKKKSFQMQL